MLHQCLVCSALTARGVRACCHSDYQEIAGRNCWCCSAWRCVGRPAAVLQTRPHTICKLVCDLSCSTACRLVITAVCSQATLGKQADTIYQKTRYLLILHTYFSVLRWSGLLLSGCGVSRAGRAADRCRCQLCSQTCCTTIQHKMELYAKTLLTLETRLMRCCERAPRLVAQPWLGRRGPVTQSDPDPTTCRRGSSERFDIHFRGAPLPQFPRVGHSWAAAVAWAWRLEQTGGWVVGWSAAGQ